MASRSKLHDLTTTALSIQHEEKDLLGTMVDPRNERSRGISLLVEFREVSKGVGVRDI
jgi:hypothetical protein